MKYFKQLLIILLTIYAPVELTYWIIRAGFSFYPEMRGQFIGELTFIWVGYIIAVSLVIERLVKDVKHDAENRPRTY